MKPTRAQAGIREAINEKLSSVFLAVLKDAASGSLSRREADALYARLGVGRAAEASEVPLLRRAAVLCDIRSPGLSTVAAALHAASPEDLKVIGDACREADAASRTAEA